MKAKSNRKKKTFKLLEKYANTIVVFLLVLTILFPFIVNRETPFSFYFNQESSWIGDAIGGITSPIIGLLSIFLIYLTYTSQKKEFKKLSKSSAIQNFEGGFFYLLKNLENQSTNLSATLNTDGISWKDYFDRSINAFHRIGKINYAEYPNALDEKFVIKQFENFYTSSVYENYKRYFANLYNLLLITHSNHSLDSSEKMNYIRMIYLNIKKESWRELFYYCLVQGNINSESPNSFKALVQYYNFFEFIEHDCLITIEHVSFYPWITFRFLDKDEKEEIVNKRNKSLNELFERI